MRITLFPQSKNQCFTNEEALFNAEDLANAHKDPDLHLGVPYEEGNGGEDLDSAPNPIFEDHYDQESEDQVGNYMDGYYHSWRTDLSSYFTVAKPDNTNPYAMQLDKQLGLEIHSPVYSLLTDASPDGKENKHDNGSVCNRSYR